MRTTFPFCEWILFQMNFILKRWKRKIIQESIPAFVFNFKKCVQKYRDE